MTTAILVFENWTSVVVDEVSASYMCRGYTVTPDGDIDHGFAVDWMMDASCLTGSRLWSACAGLGDGPVPCLVCWPDSGSIENATVCAVTLDTGGSGYVRLGASKLLVG